MSNDYFAQLFGTLEDGGQVTDEHLEKEASIALLEKIADANEVDISDVDLESMSEDELNTVLETLVANTEGVETDTEETDVEPDEIDKESAAELLGFLQQAGVDEENLYKAAAALGFGDEEHEAGLEKEAQIEYMGRKMAHYYVDELVEIDSAMRKEAMAQAKFEQLTGGQQKVSSSEEFEDAAAQIAAQWVEEYSLSKESSDEEGTEVVQTRALEMLVEAGYVDPAELG